MPYANSHLALPFLGETIYFHVPHIDMPAQVRQQTHNKHTACFNRVAAWYASYQHRLCIAAVTLLKQHGVFATVSAVRCADAATSLNQV
jgi:hypothetical protein